MHWIDRQKDRVWWLIVNEGARVGRRVVVIFYLRILHLLLIILSLGCKVFISASPRVQWYRKLIMKKLCSGLTSLQLGLIDMRNSESQDP